MIAIDDYKQEIIFPHGTLVVQFLFKEVHIQLKEAWVTSQSFTNMIRQWERDQYLVENWIFVFGNWSMGVGWFTFGCNCFTSCHKHIFWYHILSNDGVCSMSKWRIHWGCTWSKPQSEAMPYCPHTIPGCVGPNPAQAWQIPRKIQG